MRLIIRSHTHLTQRGRERNEKNNKKQNKKQPDVRGCRQMYTHTNIQSRYLLILAKKKKIELKRISLL